MKRFADLNINNRLKESIAALGFEVMTPIQKESFPVILSGRDMVGIAQTGTGKTLGYALPLLHELVYSEQIEPRVLVLLPTRELVVQVVEQFEDYSKHLNVRVLGVYGGTNINTQKTAVAEGMDILVATPGRLYDLIVHQSVSLKKCKKVVIDEVDVMLDMGFRFQLNNIFDHLPNRRQNIMFSATMTQDIEKFIDLHFSNPEKVSVAASGTRLENIDQSAFPVPNFYTKINLLANLLSDADRFEKVLVFVDSKRNADRVQEELAPSYGDELAIIHSNKTQNYRLRSIESFRDGSCRILVATDVMARGLDIDNISHVINLDVPSFPENYMHRIGRTGRAEARGESLLFFTEKEEDAKRDIEQLMDYQIPVNPLPEDVEIDERKIPEERSKKKEHFNPNKQAEDERGEAFHEKSAKNQKTNQGGSYKRKLAQKYKKPKTRGDKNANRRKQ
jgi:ATP-dependent RNA helicase RhlE